MDLERASAQTSGAQSGQSRGFNLRYRSVVEMGLGGLNVESPIASVVAASGIPAVLQGG